MIRYIRGLTALVLVVLVWTSCTAERKTAILSDKNTNWLNRCTLSSECHAGFQCLAGLCTRACEVEEDCSGLDGAVCAPLPSEGACSAFSDATPRICTLSCSAQLTCVGAEMSCAGGACFSASCVAPPDGGTRDATTRDATTRDATTRDATTRDASSLPEGGASSGNSADSSNSSDSGNSRDASATTGVDAGPEPGGATEAGATPGVGAFVPRIAPTPLGNLLQLSLAATALAADPLRDRLYAATSAQSPNYPQSLVTVDSLTGVVLDALPLGEDALSIAISDDGDTLWVGNGPTQVSLRGVAPRPVKSANASVRRGPRSLIPLRGSSTSVVLVDTEDRVVVLDELVARPNILGNRLSLDHIARGPDGHLFATDYNGSLHHLVIDAQGVTDGPVTMSVKATPSTTAAPGDLILSYLNEVWDVSSPSSPRLAGRLPEMNRNTIQGGTALLADSRTAWVLSSNIPVENPELRIVDLSTFAPQGRLALGPGVTSAGEPVKTHAGGIAFAGQAGSDASLFILARVPAPEPIVDSRNLPAHGTLVEVPLAAEHLVVDRARHRLYATICADADRLPNRLVTLDEATGTVLDTVSVGSNPTALALSTDGSTLWVSLEGSAEIRRIDLTTQFPTPGERYSLFAQTGARTQAEALFALPGTAAGTIAAQLYKPTVTGDSSRFLVVADDGKLRPLRSPGYPPPYGQHEFLGGPAGNMYGIDYSSGSFGPGGFYQYGFYPITITADGPVDGSASVMVRASFGLTYDPAGFVYAGGSMIDVRVPSAPSLVGQFLGGITAPKPGTDTVFGLTTRDTDDPLILTRGKRSTLTEEARARLGTEEDTFSNARDLVYLDTDRVAFIAKARDATPTNNRKRSSIWLSAVP